MITKKLSPTTLENIYSLLKTILLSCAIACLLQDLSSILPFASEEYGPLLVALFLLMTNIFLHIVMQIRYRFLPYIVLTLLLGFLLFQMDNPIYFLLMILLLITMAALLISSHKQLLIISGFLSLAILLIMEGLELFSPAALATWSLEHPLSMTTICLLLGLFLYALSITFNPLGQTLIPWIIILVICLSFMPRSEDPYSWTWFRSMTSRLEERISYFALSIKSVLEDSDGNFHYQVGYSEHSALWGNLQNSTYDQLQLVGKKQSSPLYLRGTVSSTYHQTHWEDSAIDSLTPATSEYLSLLYALSGSALTSEEAKNVLQEVSYDIQFDHLRTKTLFYPQYILSLQTGNVFYDEQNANLRLRKAKGKDYEYQLTWIAVNHSHPLLLDCLYQLEEEHTLTAERYQRMVDLASTCLPSLGTFPYTLAEVATYLDAATLSANNSYQEISDSLSLSVQSFAQSITGTQTTTFAKCIALETYLRENYSYSLNSLPSETGLDPVVNFLFYHPEGSCSSYATALVLLLRSIDIPARYVEGYRLDYTESSSFISHSITSSMAHAWVEVYLDGFGWYPLEPTTSYRPPSSYAVTPERESSNPVAPYLPSNLGSITEPQTDVSDTTKPAQTALILRSLTVFGILLAAIFLFWLLQRIYTATMYRQGSITEKANIELWRILLLLRMLGHTRLPSESIPEFMSRIPSFEPAIPLSLMDYSAHYENCRYNPSADNSDSITYLVMYRKCFQKKFLFLLFHKTKQ